MLNLKENTVETTGRKLLATQALCSVNVILSRLRTVVLQSFMYQLGHPQTLLLCSVVAVKICTF